MAIEINSETLEKINRFTRRELSADEVFCFNLVLCDNEIDRDNEKFSKKALEKLAELYVGKTGIFNHDPKGENQTARIFEAAVVEVPSKKTTDGETYAYLSAKAYMVKTDKNADLIKEIDAGIKRRFLLAARLRVTSARFAERILQTAFAPIKRAEAMQAKSAITF